MFIAISLFIVVIRWIATEHKFVTHQEGVPKEKGWWYTVPTTESMQHKSTINDLFPHIGTLLGIPEYIVAYILFKIGVMKIRKDKVGVTTSPMMWNDFMRGNLLTINEMEITQVRIMKVRYTLMKIGAIRTYRRSLKVIKSELFPLIRNEIIEDFNNQYFSSKPMDATKNTNNNSKFVDPEEENEEVAEVIVNDIPDTLTGNIPSEEEFPMMHHFKIPTDNKHCVNNLLVELLGNVEDSNKCFSVYKYNKEITYSRIPKGTSRKQLWLLNNNVKQTVSYGTETNNNNLQIRLNSSLSALKNTYEDQFEESLIEMGVVTSDTPKISAELWIAMSEEANITVKQQRVINKYLTHHFKRRICAAEVEIRGIGNNYVIFEKFQREIIENEDPIDYFYRSPDEVIRNELVQNNELIFNDNVHMIDRIEIIFSGDHGKGTFTSIVTMIFRYQRNSNVKDKFIDLMVGEIQSNKDSLAILAPLVKKFDIGFKNMLFDNSGNGKMILIQEKSNKKIKNLFYDINKTIDERYEIIKIIPMHLYMCGDIKFLFFMLGREGFDKHHCLLCNLTKAQMLTYHQTPLNDTRRNQLTLWNNNLICTKVLEQKQKDMNNENYSSVGIKEYPLLLMIPVSRIILPLLHILLGLGNKVRKNLFDFISERIEILHADEVQAINNTILAELEVDDLMLKYDLADAEYQEHKSSRIDFNKTHKRKLNEEEIARKTFITNKTNECKEYRDSVEKELSTAKGICRNRKSEENEVRDKLGKRYVVKNYIERTIFKRYLIVCSAYHGGDLEGNSCRRLMENGVQIFNEIRDYLVSELRNENVGNGLSNVTIEEIIEFCNTHGKLLVICDSIMSAAHTKKGQVTEDLLQKVEGDLELFREVWLKTGMTITHKLHLLLTHLVPQLRSENGIADMTESRIERYHQEKERDRVRVVRCNQQQQQKHSMAKMQQIRNLENITALQQEVHDKSKRKMRVHTIVRRAEARSVKMRVKDEFRESVKLNSASESSSSVILKPREKMKRDVKIRNLSNQNS